MAKSETTRNRLQMYWDHSDPTQHYTCMVLEHLKALPARQRNDWLREAVVNHLARFLADDPQNMTPSLQSAHHFARLLANDLGVSLTGRAESSPPVFESNSTHRSGSAFDKQSGHPAKDEKERAEFKRGSEAGTQETSSQREYRGNDQRGAIADTESPSQSHSSEKDTGAVKDTALGAKLKGMMGG